MYAHDEFEPDHSTSPTGHVIEALELYGYRPAEGEADPRITPEDTAIQGAVADIFDALISTMADGLPLSGGPVSILVHDGFPCQGGCLRRG
jgi:hypothetical protein